MFQFVSGYLCHCPVPFVLYVLRSCPGDSRNKTRPAKVVVVANSKQKVVSSTHKVVKYAPEIFGFDYTLYWCIMGTIDETDIDTAF